MIDGMCVSVCVCVCFAWEVGVCFVLRFLHELFLTYLFISSQVSLFYNPIPNPLYNPANLLKLINISLVL